MKIENVKLAEMQAVNSPPQYNKDGPLAEEMNRPPRAEAGKGQGGGKPEALSPDAASSPRKGLSPEELEKVVQEANKSLEQVKNKQIRFFVDKRTGKQGVRIVDAETKKVIKQIPPEEMLELAARIKEQIGALVDETI